MFDFLKKEDEKIDYGKILKEKGMEELLNDPFFNEYMDCMMKGYENPGDMILMCMKVIVSLAKYFEMPKPFLKEILSDMERMFDAIPSKELMESMDEFDLI